jgi:alpha-mannosidase
MKKNLFLLLSLLTLWGSSAQAQSFFTTDDHLINGYAQKVSGLDFDYMSCIPGLRQSMLIRATSGSDAMEWQTDAVPAGIREEYATFVWIAAIGSGPGRARMDLAIDGVQRFSFYTDARARWSVAGDQGSRLDFNSIMVDQYGDHHGYMILRIPAKQLKTGQVLSLKVTGSQANLSSWYMTFKKPVQTGVQLNAFPAILKQGTERLQLVEAAIFYFGDSVVSSIYANGKLLKTAPLRFGYNAVNLGLHPVDKPTKVNLKVTAGKFNIENTVMLNPVKKWKIDLVQHSHTDIGYTRSQTEILAEHLRYIDYALDYCDATDSYPENARFRWTCEASWPLDEYLKTRPVAQVERLKRRIAEGRIQVTGMYFNFDELPDEQVLAASLKALGRIRDAGIPVSTAMQDDVNGVGWGLNDYFNQLGVRYLNMGINVTRSLPCFDRPTLFWWESPSGKRMLTFRAEHYMTGNTLLEIQSGDIDKFKNNLFNYLISLDQKGYPFDEMAIQHSGYLTDNSPPSTLASDMIRKWNEVFEWPQLTTAVTETFFINMERDHAADVQVIRGAWPDWWTDGFGASARESATTRQSSSALSATKAALSMASLSGVPLPAATWPKIDLAENALLFYTEHTTGYSESISQPFSQQTLEQRGIKESYAWEANRRTASLGEEAMGLLQSTFSREKEPSLLVFNSLNWERSGLVTVYIDHQIVPRGKMAGIFDHDGNRMPAQPVNSRSDGTYWAVWTKNIPAFGYRKFSIRALDNEIALPETEMPASLENQWYSVKFDASRAALSSWFDKDLNKELTDPGAGSRLGEFILEQLGNRSQLESQKLDQFTRQPLDTVWFDSMLRGEIWTSLKFCGESVTTENPKGFSIEIRLYHTTKRMDIACSMVKKSITTPESFYIAFPFGLADGKHFTEVQGGVIRTGIDQIPGSSNDWYTVQDFTSVRNTEAQIVMGCAEMPLMQFGAINTGRFKTGAVPQGTHVFSWPMNNYWTTNFNADQRGGHNWSYYLTSSPDTSNGFASRFGWGCRIPLLTRVIPGEGSGDQNWGGSYISGWPANTVLITAEPQVDGKSILIHLRETEGKKAVLQLMDQRNSRLLKITEVDATGRQIDRGHPEIGPLESAFFKIER